MQLRPYQHDISTQTADKLQRYGIAYLAMQVRTGKTLTAIAAAHKAGACKVLFITKKKAIPSILADLTAYAPPYAYQVINYESLHKVNIRAADLIIIDEPQRLGGYPKPCKAAKQLKKAITNQRIIYLSGTPTPETWSQIYHQLYISHRSPFASFPNFYKWALTFVNIKKKYIGSVQVNDYSGAIIPKIEAHLAPLFLSFTQEQAGFTQAVQEQFFTVHLPDKLKRLFAQMDRAGILKHNNKTASATNAADQLNKLSQLVGGTLIFDEHTNGQQLSDYKAAFVRDKWPSEKLAILYRYRAERDTLITTFQDCTEDPQAFNNGQARVFIGQVVSTREGVSLRAADRIVIYNIDFSATSYFQARARAQHKDRTSAALVAYLFSDTGLEQKIYGAVSKKKNFTAKYYKSAKRSQNTKQHKEAPGAARLHSHKTNGNRTEGMARPAGTKGRQGRFFGSENEARARFFNPGI